MAPGSGLSPVEVAEAMGHSVQTLFSTYAHVIAGLRGSAGRPAADEIAAARATESSPISLII